MGHGSDIHGPDTRIQSPVNCTEVAIPLQELPEHPVTLHVHDGGASRVILMVPGWNGNSGGYLDKYVTLANWLAATYGVTVVRMGNRTRTFGDDPRAWTRNACARVRAALAHVCAIAARASAPVGVVGVSAGAALVSRIHGEFSRIDRLLLVSPAVGSIVSEDFASSAARVHVAVGRDDEVIPSELVVATMREAVPAERLTLVTIPRCDHQWRGVANGRLLSLAPCWAFFGFTPYPPESPGEAGIVLYP